MIKPVLTILAALALLPHLPGSMPANSAPKALSVDVGQVNLATFQPQRLKFGELMWKGGLVLSSDDPRFGGFSGLALSKNGDRFVAISDRAWWLKGKFISKEGVLQSAKSMQMARLKTRSSRNSFRDSESLAPWSASGIDGTLLVGFERRERIRSYKFGRRGFLSKPLGIKHPKEISSGPYNGELEAIGRFYSGPRKKWMIAASEQNFDNNGNIKSWLWRRSKTISFSLERFEDYQITDLAVLPNGKSFVTLERSFNLPNLPGFAIRQFNLSDIKHARTAKGKLLFAGRQPFFSIDNMEGIAVHKTKNGRIQLTLISDDNFNRSIQRTLIFRFEMKP